MTAAVALSIESYLPIDDTTEEHFLFFRRPRHSPSFCVNKGGDTNYKGGWRNLFLTVISSPNSCNKEESFSKDVKIVNGVSQYIK